MQKDDLDLDLPLLERDASMGEKLQCVIRNFILHQADLHNCYDANRRLVTLPCVITSLSGNPEHQVHLNCLTSPPLTQAEKDELDLEDEIERAYSK